VCSLERVYYFMGQDDTVQDLASLYITKFLFGDDEWKDGFKTDDDFGDDFVDDIAQGDGPRIS
jgi:hypothetical protein